MLFRSGAFLPDRWGHWGLRGELDGVASLEELSLGSIQEGISISVVHLGGSEVSAKSGSLSRSNCSGCKCSISNFLQRIPPAVQAYSQMLGPLASTEVQSLTRCIKAHFYHHM